jgi:hypothetical protein
MALFEFDLANVEDILPWGKPGEQSLSWYALTFGQFRMIVGDQVLFRYTDEISSHWGCSERHADYQVAAFVRSILGCVAAAVAPLPPRIERLASNWQLLMELEKPIDDMRAVDDLWYDAWRWLGERSPSTSYLVACPRFQFVRVGDELRIHWDNREQEIDGLPVWTARQGVRIVSVEAFQEECREFVRRLLSNMHERIAGIEAGSMKPQVEVSTSSLKEQHETWRAEFATYFADYQPDVQWEEAENALQAIAEKKGLRF